MLVETQINRNYDAFTAFGVTDCRTEKERARRVLPSHGLSTVRAREREYARACVRACVCVCVCVCACVCVNIHSRHISCSHMPGVDRTLLFRITHAISSSRNRAETGIVCSKLLSGIPRGPSQFRLTTAFAIASDEPEGACYKMKVFFDI